MADDDLIPSIELTQWRAGRVLDQADEDMLMRYLREVDEEENQRVDDYQMAREQILRELGGDELVRAFAEDDESMSAKAIQAAMQKFYERRAALRATAT